MPIHCPIETIRPTQAEFGKIAFDVMNHVFAIHNQFGRFFDEAVYKRELSYRMPGIELELPVTVSHDNFLKIYKLDILASRCGICKLPQSSGVIKEPSHVQNRFSVRLSWRDLLLQPNHGLAPRLGHLHDQRMQLLAPDIAFKLTAFADRLERFEVHAQRLLRHTNLKAIQWANITHGHVTFKTIC